MSGGGGVVGDATHPTGPRTVSNLTQTGSAPTDRYLDVGVRCARDVSP